MHKLRPEMVQQQPWCQVASSYVILLFFV